MLEAVAFDLDDTLILERDFVRSGFTVVGAYLRAHVDERRDWFAALWRDFEGGVRGNAFDRALREAGVEPVPGLVADLVRLYREHRPALQPCADGVAAIRGLGLPPERLGVITDGAPLMQRHKFETLGLTPVISHFLCTDVWGLEFRKPHARAFEEFERLSRTPGERCAYVGDNPSKDFAVPHRRGWTTVRVVRAGGLHIHEPSAPGEVDLTLSDLGHLRRVLGLER